jgi:monoamine oxidase
MARTTLRGLHVIVAGAGLAGLTAAREIAMRGATVHVVEARARVGGRVWTVRRPGEAVHVEAGGEFIEHEHEATRGLAKALNLRLTRVLGRGFGSALKVGGAIRRSNSQTARWKELNRLLKPEITAFTDTGCDWNSAVAAAIAAESLEDVLDRRRPHRRVGAMATALRGFYLADPDQLSALVPAEQGASSGTPGRSAMYRIAGGNDRLPQALARALPSAAVSLETIVRAVTSEAAGVRVAVTSAAGRQVELRGDYAILTLPAPLLRACRITPPLDAVRQAALAQLPNGPATKAFVQFGRPWWRRANTPRAYGTNLPCGAVWDGAEEQKGAAVLTMLGGGRASDMLQAAVSSARSRRAALSWLGARDPGELIGEPIVWERDPWARGGYAVFGPGFEPRWRDTLAQSHGRILFAGEHTSRQWQGFMNGAIESGIDAVRTLEQLHRLRQLRVP